MVIYSSGTNQEYNGRLENNGIFRRLGLLFLTGLVAGTTVACSGRPVAPNSDQCRNTPDFLDAREYVLRERFQLKPRYDLIAGDDNSRVGTMKRRVLSFRKRTGFISDGENIGKVRTKLSPLSFTVIPVYDMTIYDENGEVINTSDYRFMGSVRNFGFFYSEIKDPQGNVVAILERDPFSLWRDGNRWKYFTVKDPDTEELMAEVEYTGILPDRYRIRNYSGMDNRTLAGIIGVLDNRLIR